MLSSTLLSCIAWFTCICSVSLQQTLNKRQLCYLTFLCEASIVQIISKLDLGRSESCF